MGRTPALASALACAALAFAGCGGDGGDGGTGAGARPAEGGSLHYALAGDPGRLDPLLATDRPSQVVTRQIHEPLVATLSGPFGDLRELPGLARGSSASSDSSIWRFRLRRRIRFGDGAPFNASAVLANADRWLATAQGRALVPGLVAADAPRPDLARFILDGPDPAFGDRLADARLGLVSPRALHDAASSGEVSVADGGSGTGAFELRELEPGESVVLARNVGWWGTELDLGPALDQVVFPVIADPRERVGALADGEVEVADELGPAEVAAVREDPLLTLAGGAVAPPVGIERSVRGLETETGVPVLSGAWLTKIGVGE